MPTTALRRRAATDGARPFYTHYDGVTGSRIELSGTTFANWVDKTVNLMDSLGIEPGAVVRLELAATDPGHWVTAVWHAAAWQWGCTVAADARADLVVGGPTVPPSGPTTIACSLHPLGRPLTDLPAGCIDYSEVFGEPDVHQSAASPTAVDGVEPRSDRALFVDPQPGWDSVASLLVAPLLGGGSTVVVTGGTPDLVERIRRDERISGAERP